MFDNVHVGRSSQALPETGQTESHATSTVSIHGVGIVLNVFVSLITL